MASSASVDEGWQHRFLTGHGAASLRAAILLAAIWSVGTLLLTLVSLLVEVREYGWRGFVAPASLAYAAPFAVASFALRFLRWHLLAIRVAPGLSVTESFTANTIGFGLMMTPGRAGEALKLLLLRERLSTPVAMSLPIFVMEKGCEAIGLAGLAIGASLFLAWGEDVAPTARFAVAGLALVVLVVGATFRNRLIRLAPHLPLVGRVLRRPGPAALWTHLTDGADRVLSWPVLLTTLGLTLVARVFDGIVIVWVGGLFGIELSLAAGCLLIGSSGFLGGVSMLPGGVGVAEGTLIGLFLAFGAGPAAAVAAALTSRILIFWIWVALGLGFALRYAVHPWAQHAEGG
ncbi:MAG: lysylphosphatidylglycerol synthase domain-containing protein [Chloroflexota bacterium]